MRYMFATLLKRLDGSTWGGLQLRLEPFKNGLTGIGMVKLFEGMKTAIQSDGRKPYFWVHWVRLTPHTEISHIV